jgi:hypothetical protein
MRKSVATPEHGQEQTRWLIDVAANCLIAIWPPLSSAKFSSSYRRPASSVPIFPPYQHQRICFSKSDINN